jgi:uncharacterized radical SAM superfamily Fe-S cluster-containing enzyme
VEREHGIYLRRRCPKHGEFAIPVWRKRYDFARWIKDAPLLQEGENPACPGACGLCGDHRQSTCCVLLPITARCDLACRHCFAAPDQAADPPLEQVVSWLTELTAPGQTLVQLSGGEPTLRDDLPAVVAAAKRAGCRYVQLNSNGIRLAEEPSLAERLAQAGLSFVFLQFDGLDDGVYEHLRGRPLSELKQRAIENCARHNIGVTLVPVIVPGVNTGQVGQIIRFAVEHSPVVRGVHFQPVSYFGRSPLLPETAPRYTLDELLYDIIGQSGGLVGENDFSPSRCDHPLCGLHGDFVTLPGGGVKALHQRNVASKTVYCGAEEEEEDCCGGPAAAAKNREFVGRRWQRPPDSGNCCCGAPPEADLTDMEQFAARVQSHGFTITAMAFQDAATLDIARLRQCSLHVYARGKHIPFCAYYL